MAHRPARGYTKAQTRPRQRPLSKLGELFTTCFLEEGILHTDAWQAALSEPAELESFRAQALALLDNAAGFHSVKGASTEQELIRPLLELLGWADNLPQQGNDSNEDFPDHLLFGDADVQVAI